jgi:transcriptional regulator with XRE-family HTH domain
MLNNFYIDFDVIRVDFTSIPIQNYLKTEWNQMNAFDLKQLNDRRKELGMSFAALAQRSGVPVPTVQKILYGQERRPDFYKVSAIAGALGIILTIAPTSTTMTATPAQEFRRQQAERKAQQLVSMTQATSGLEAQAVPEIVPDLTARTASELLAGSRLELWKEL